MSFFSIFNSALRGGKVGTIDWLSYFGTIPYFHFKLLGIRNACFLRHLKKHALLGSKREDHEVLFWDRDEEGIIILDSGEIKEFYLKVQMPFQCKRKLDSLSYDEFISFKRQQIHSKMKKKQTFLKKKVIRDKTLEKLVQRACVPNKDQSHVLLELIRYSMGDIHHPDMTRYRTLNDRLVHYWKTDQFRRVYPGAWAKAKEYLSEAIPIKNKTILQFWKEQKKEGKDSIRNFDKTEI